MSSAYFTNTSSLSREVIDIHIRKDCVKPGVDEGMYASNKKPSGVSIDLEKVRPVARLGYGQEYTVVLEMIH